MNSGQKFSAAAGAGMSGSEATAQELNTGFLIAVVGGKGGVGKSMFAANLATAMAVDKKISPALIDADMQGTGDLNLLLGLKNVQGYGEQLLQGKIRNSEGLKRFMAKVPIPNSKDFLHCLQLTENPEKILEQNPENIDYAFKIIKKSFSVTVVDCGSRIEGPILNILDVATVILVVTNPEILVLNQTRKILEKLQTALFPPEMTKLVLNKFLNGSAYNAKFLEQSFKRQVVGVIPDEAGVSQSSLAKGSPLVLSAGNSASAKAYYGTSRILIDGRLLEKLALMQKPLRDKKADVIEITGKNKPREDARSRMGREPTDPRSIFKLKVHDQLVEKMNLKKEQLNKNMTFEEKRELTEKTKKVVVDIMNNEDHPWKQREETAQLVKEIVDEALGLGPLEDLLADPTVSEIMVNRADLIYIERLGKNMKSKITFSSNAQVMSCIERIVNPIGRRIDEKTPYVDARLPDGSRVHAIIPPLSIDGPMITIRKFPTKRLTVKDFVKYETITPEIADFLRACIEAHLNVIISGGTGSGKTTLLNILSSFIPATERIITVEDAAELSLVQEHVARLETRPANIEGSGAVTIRDLVRQTLRMKPDRVVIGEVRGGEALDMLQAMNTGHDGSMATVHANNPRDALARLETLVLMAGMDLPSKAIREQISSAVHLIIQQSRLSDGTRKVTHITEVIGMQADTITTQDIFVFKQKGLNKERKIIGQHEATGFIPKFIEKLEAAGVKIPRGLFKTA